MTWCQAPLHVLVGSSYIFGGMSIQALGPFFESLFFRCVLGGLPMFWYLP